MAKWTDKDICIMQQRIEEIMFEENKVNKWCMRNYSAFLVINTTLSQNFAMVLGHYRFYEYKIDKLTTVIYLNEFSIIPQNPFARSAEFIFI